MPAPSISGPVAAASSLGAKRVFDLVMGTLCFLLGLPVILIISVAVGLTSPGPVLFRQTRIGRNGRPFTIIKFRTMRLNEDSDETWTVGDDPRVTPVGRFLRRTSLDELPQLINVLKGDMSLVGPRPERPFYVEQFKGRVPGYEFRHVVAPGMTGWAQVHGLRGDTSIEDRVRLDNDYIERRTFWLDLRIILRTVAAVVKGDGS